MDLVTRVSLIQQQTGHLLEHCAVHQPENSALGSFELAETGDKPPQGDHRALEEQWDEPAAIQAERRDPIDGPCRLEVWLAAEHGNVADHRPGSGSGNNQRIRVRPAVQLRMRPWPPHPRGRMRPRVLVDMDPASPTASRSSALRRSSRCARMRAATTRSAGRRLASPVQGSCHSSWPSLSRSQPRRSCCRCVGGGPPRHENVLDCSSR